jgi:ubiquinol-cytochrome c reductase cytochrome c1 subunit
MFRKFAAKTASRSWLGPSVLGGLYAAGGAAGYAVYANAEKVDPPHNHWSHSSAFSTYDTASLRRGYEVYRQVCSTCHSMNLIYFRNLVGNTHTEEQAKALAGSFDVVDGPNDVGEMFERPGKLSDSFSAPYPNDEFARNVNNGALPPDLSCIAKARHSGPDYIYALLTGYDHEIPAGAPAKPGLYFNPYFDGGYIGMTKPLSDGQVEYEDGTPATVSQMAKDVATFLQWCSEPEQDERRKKGFQFMVTWVFMAGLAGYYKRFTWASMKTRKISWIDPK